MKKYIKNMELNKVVETLSLGAVLRGDDGTMVECINGILTKRRGDRWCINPIIGDDDDLYFDIVGDELKINIGKFYKTRDGAKAYVYAINSEGKFCVAVEGGNAYSVFQGGYYSEDEESDRDLVSEYKKEKSETKTRQNPKLYDTYKELAEEGLTIDQIAERLGKSYIGVHHYITRHPELKKLVKKAKREKRC